MGQAEILEFLESHLGKWHSSLDICQHIEGTHNTVAVALRRLRDSDLVEYKEMRKPQKHISTSSRRELLWTKLKYLTFWKSILIDGTHPRKSVK